MMMYMNQDTIAAISTSQGNGGIGIIRISGKDAVGIADGIFRGKKTIQNMASHTLQYGHIIDPNVGTVVDEVMLSKMKAPATYTREDTIEINCHGNYICQQKILSLLFQRGARPAEPGEFTKRAFLNGRIDLTQAEAVMDLISAQTARSQEAAVSQLSGKISSYLNQIIDRLLDVMARIEVTVDYPEHDDELPVSIIAGEELEQILAEIQKAIDSYQTGKLIKTGIQTVIIGKPNVGKSTLLNALSGYQRAIVTNIPGTTRDIVEEAVNIDGILLHVKDTAGIRNTEDIVEQMGVDLARESLKGADLIVYIVALSEYEPIDPEILQEMLQKKVIVVLNKEDLVKESRIREISEELKEKMGKDAILITAALSEDRGLKEIKEGIKDLFFQGEISGNNEILITAQRHADLLERSCQSLKDALSAMEQGMPLDMISIDIRNTAEFLSQITGDSIAEDLTDRIFSTFCLGK